MSGSERFSPPTHSPPRSPRSPPSSPPPPSHPLSLPLTLPNPSDVTAKVNESLCISFLSDYLKKPHKSYDRHSISAYRDELGATKSQATEMSFCYPPLPRDISEILQAVIGHCNNELQEVERQMKIFQFGKFAVRSRLIPHATNFLRIVNSYEEREKAKQVTQQKNSRPNSPPTKSRNSSKERQISPRLDLSDEKSVPPLSPSAVSFPSEISPAVEHFRPSLTRLSVSAPTFFNGILRDSNSTIVILSDEKERKSQSKGLPITAPNRSSIPLSSTLHSMPIGRTSGSNASDPSEQQNTPINVNNNMPKALSDPSLSLHFESDLLELLVSVLEEQSAAALQNNPSAVQNPPDSSQNHNKLINVADRIAVLEFILNQISPIVGGLDTLPSASKSIRLSLLEGMLFTVFTVYQLELTHLYQMTEGREHLRDRIFPLIIPIENAEIFKMQIAQIRGALALEMSKIPPSSPKRKGASPPISPRNSNGTHSQQITQNKQMHSMDRQSNSSDGVSAGRSSNSQNSSFSPSASLSSHGESRGSQMKFTYLVKD